MGVQDVWIFYKLPGKKQGWSRVAAGFSDPCCSAVHLSAGVVTTRPWEERFTPWTERLPSRLACDLLGNITFCCFHLPAGVITTGPWEERFTPWTARLPNRVACDLLGTITFCCFLNWPRFLPLPSSPLPLSPCLLWGCQYLVVCAGPRKTHFCTSEPYWPPDDTSYSRDHNSGPDGRELCSLTTDVFSFS